MFPCSCWSNGEPITVSLSGDPQRNVILWKDHRAITEANEINKLGHPVLKFVGGSISPEMEPPKPPLAEEELV